MNLWILNQVIFNNNTSTTTKTTNVFIKINSMEQRYVCANTSKFNLPNIWSISRVNALGLSRFLSITIYGLLSLCYDYYKCTAQGYFILNLVCENHYNNIYLFIGFTCLSCYWKFVQVRWPNGTKSNYRFGYDGKYDVSIWYSTIIFWKRII